MKNINYSSIRPGKEWLDTEGKRIQAHAGCMLYVDGTFYWYGENKEKSFSEYEIWHWGVKLYSSKDLYNWKDEGIIMLPNPSETATFEDIHGEWKILGDPHVDDAKKTSFDSQISCIFKHPHYEDLYIAMADRWLTDLTEDSPSGVEYFAARFDPDYPMSEKRREELLNMKMEDVTAKNTAMADYVWLPIRFIDDVPYIFWHDEWKIEEQ